MAFTELEVPNTLDTSEHNLVTDFFSPLLRHAITYDRGVGYFSSGWLRTNAQGMAAFAENGGRARWITSPILSEVDWEYLQKGEEARTDEILREALEKNVADLADSLEKDTLSALAWMVADHVITFRLALPRWKLKQGNFHVKFGLFEDEESNWVAFNGSYNDSVQGLRNYESLHVFRSWDETSEYVENDRKRFARLWHNEDPNVVVHTLPEAIRAKIVALRSDDRPYEPTEKHSYPELYGSGYVHEGESGISLWDHQKEALDAWVANDCVGLLNMATGSGKTITALFCAESRPHLQLLVIAVPTKNLVEQWAEEVAAVTNFPKPVLVYDSSAKWQDVLFRKMRSKHRRDWPEPLVAIGTISSLSGDRFQGVLNDAGIPEHAMLIADEVHNIGAPTRQRIMDPAYTMRLGLSATPERSHDEQGSAAIMDYFEEEVYRYSMKQALADERLCPYDYHVYAAPLTDEEYEQYLKLTRQILSMRGGGNSENATLYTNNQLDGDGKDVEQLLFKRARILKKAEFKQTILKAILDEHPFDRGLLYCADTEQMGDARSVLRDLGIVHLKYIGETPSEHRRTALSALERGQIPLIVAIDCLDEGVDVPVVDTAIILASSTNTRQFIQRRGRVLRKAPGKSKAKLIDVVTLPPASTGRSGKWLLKRELERAKLMADLAENRLDALYEVKQHTEPYGVLLTELLQADSHAE
jgi:superfamily II DNA or RNA helicase